MLSVVKLFAKIKLSNKDVLIVGQLADSFEALALMDRNGSLRNARTALTGAQNAGRQEAYREADEMGIAIKKEWICTQDSRTRDSHIELDGQIVDYDEPFVTSEGHEIMYPGDSTAEPCEVWNCRCTMRAILPKHKIGQERVTYKEWVDERKTIKNDNSHQDNSNEGTIAVGKSKLTRDENDDNIALGKGKPYEIELDREERKEIMRVAKEQEKTIFCHDTKDNKFASEVALLKPKDGYYDVAMHGIETQVEFFGKPIDAYTLAQIIYNRDDYKPGTPIRLLSCNTGSTENTGDCVAQLLANELGVIVEAPTDLLYIEKEKNGESNKSRRLWRWYHETILFKKQVI